MEKSHAWGGERSSHSPANHEDSGGTTTLHLTGRVIPVCAPGHSDRRWGTSQDGWRDVHQWCRSASGAVHGRRRPAVGRYIQQWLVAFRTATYIP